ncbi:hypothetical protein [Hymenobacter busanensis]|nr:hypothetical protein [Hymenobacter busanensis]QHJ06450.1 hypothetical protein GUY19_03700 [Hymenobacter busanensis]
MRIVIGASALLALLGSCAGASRLPAAPDGVELTVQPQADSAFNIVWLRARVHNRSPRRVWILQQRDSVDLACTMNWGIALSGFTPKGDTLAFCDQCIIDARPQYVALEPGAQRITYLKVNFNYVFPRNELSRLPAPCDKYINRTHGEYRFQVVYKDHWRRKRDSLPHFIGNTAIIKRK